jgi:ribosomal protein S12 methylthiotransferase accessory factor
MPARAFNESIPSRVAQSVTDPARLCPVLPGPAWLRGDCLSVRSGPGSFEVEAPNALLVQLYQLCDGVRTRAEMEASAPELRGLVDALLARGVLDDASLLTLRAAAYGQHGSGFGRTAARAVTAELCRRFIVEDTADPNLPPGAQYVGTAPLAGFFTARISSGAFAGHPISEDALVQFAWSIAGVVRDRHEVLGPGAARRTLGSAGGMHLLQVHLVLQQPVGTYEAAVYRVVYPAEKLVVLQRLAPENGALPGAFIKSGKLVGATGAVFLSADVRVAAMRYGNRALQYLLMEAGAALHNAALTAPPLQMGFAVIGGYDDAAVQRLCALEDRFVLGSGLFGAATTAPSPP